MNRVDSVALRLMHLHKTLPVSRGCRIPPLIAEVFATQ